MTKHLISMALACWAMLGFIYVTDGANNVDWLGAFVLYSSIIPICIWTTMLVMAKGGGNRR